MNSKTKILIGILVIGTILIGGLWVWNNQFKSITNEKYCEEDSDCVYECGCINKEFKGKRKFIMCKPIADANCKCVNNICELVLPQKQQVAITTDKTEYGRGEEVKITVSNNLDEIVCFESCNTFYFEKKDVIWKKYLIKRCEVSFIRECINSSEIKEFKGEFSEVDFLKGIYRIAVPIYTGCHNEEFPCEEEKIFYSNEFTIKEKQKVTITTDNTEIKHFIIHYQDTEPSEETINILNNSYFQITGDLGISDPDLQFIEDKRINIFIYKNSDDYHNATGRPSWSQGVNEYETLSIHLIKGTNFNQIIPHEMAHLLFKDQFPDNWYYTPDWIHEGIAFYEEEKFDDSYIKSRLLPQLDIIKKGNYLSYNDLLEKAPSKTGQKNYLWYAQSLSMTKYLINEYGMERLLQLSGYLAEKESIDEALARAYKDTPLVQSPKATSLSNILIDEWFEYVKNRNNL